MSMGLIATGFSIARAAALSVITVDLSWEYAVAAIWSNLELWIAIVAANLAVSRSILHHLRNHRSVSFVAHTVTKFYSKNRTGSRKKNNQIRKHSWPLDTSTYNFGTTLTNHNTSANVISVDCRRASTPRSVADSDIPLEPRIQKKTEFVVTEEGHRSSQDIDRHSDSESQKDKSGWPI
jgi:hypothetical protein